MIRSDAEIWLVIGLLALGTFVIRFSFLGLIGDRPMPPLVLRLLRYTPVAVLPGMVAPLVLWPAATDGSFDPPRAFAALAALAVGLASRNMLLAASAGALTLYGGLYLLS